MDAIKFFIDKLGTNPLCPDLDISRCGINLRKAQSSTAKPLYALVKSDVYFIYHFFIPFLNGLQFLTKKELDFKDWKSGLEVLVRGLHLTEVGQSYLFELISGMNSGRSFSNENISEVGSLSNKDVLSLPPLYEFGPNGGIRLISNKQWVTPAKFFMLTPYSKDNELFKPLYLQGKGELCNFFALSDVTIYKNINNGQPLLSPKTQITYTITKIF